MPAKISQKSPPSSVEPLLSASGDPEQPLAARHEYTVDEVIDDMGFGKFQTLMMLYAGLAWTADGMEMSVLSFLGPSIKCVWDVNNSQQSWLSSIVFAGFLVGAFTWGLIADERGRKMGFLIPAIIVFAGGAMSALAPNFELLLASRLLVGLGLGGTHVAFTLFCEFIPSQVRGRMLILLCLFWTLGSILAGGSAWLILPHASWRWFLLVCSLPMAMLLIFYPWLPESPHYLATSGHIKAADHVLRRVARVNKYTMPSGRLHNPMAVAKSEEEGEEEVEEEDKVDGKFTLGELCHGMFNLFGQLFHGSLARVSSLAICIFFLAALIYYGLVLLTTTVYATETPDQMLASLAALFPTTPGAAANSVATPVGGEECVDGKPLITGENFKDIFVVSCSELPMLIVCAVLVEVIGRKHTITLFSIFTGIAILPLVLGSPLCRQVFGWFDVHCPSRTASENTIFLFFARGCGMCMLQVIYVYTPEVLPTCVRAFGTGIGNAAARIGGIITPFVAVYLFKEGFPGVAVIIFVACCVLVAILSALLPFETKGADLVDTPQEFEEAMKK